MNKKIALIFFLFSTITAFAQEQRIKIKGWVKNDSANLQDVNIINKATNLGTSTNQNGKFEIHVKKGDTLQFSSVAYTNRAIVITDTHINTKQIKVYLEQSIVHLDEVMLHQKIRLNFGDVALPKGAMLSNNDNTLRKPPNVSKFTNPTNPIGVNFVEVFKMFTKNLRKKRKEKLEFQNKIEEDKIKFISTIRTSFPDDFFIQNLKIEQDKINLFIDFCESNGLRDYYNKNNFMLTNFFVLQSYEFKKLNN